jgi:hypothetical protein
MVSLNKAQKKVMRWERYLRRTIKPLTGDDHYASNGEFKAWVRSGEARMRYRRRRGELTAD